MRPETDSTFDDLADNAVSPTDDLNTSGNPDNPGNTNNTTEPLYAHTPNAAGEWHTLSDHLVGVARRASAFGAPLGLNDAGWWAGLWHDVGKASCVFQDYLAFAERSGTAAARERYPLPGREHKVAGTRLALGVRDLPVAFAIDGHHGGIPDRTEMIAIASTLPDEPPVMPDDLIKAITDHPSLADCPERYRAVTPSDGHIHYPMPEGGPGHKQRWEMVTRFVASCLVDADYLDTAEHFGRDREWYRRRLDLDTVLDRFDAATGTLFADAPATPVNAERARWADHVRSRAAESPRGVYRLTGRTGIGKTIGGFAAVAAHARANGHRRIVVAAPFMAVTDQTAATLRRYCGGDGALLEHHSGIDAVHESTWRRLASENWDAPVVVTTTVQLFESLFSNRPSAVRKLHRLADSIIVIDEAQTIPTSFLAPILSALDWLVEHAGVTVVLQTATQPAYEHAATLDVIAARNLADWGDLELGAAMDRVRWSRTGVLDHAEVATALAAHDQVLCIVNSIADAQRIAASLDGALCLTTRQCQAHRSEVLAEIRRRLDAGERCIVVATQLVEAGVDLDFPTVWRAMGPLTSLAQAAGRCNRNGLLAEPGEVVTFDLSGGRAPLGDYRNGIIATRVVAAAHHDTFDPSSPEQIDEWYRIMFADAATEETFDAHHIEALRASFDFPEVASAFHLIPPSRSVVVRWGIAADVAWVDKVLRRLGRGDTPSRDELRRLAKFTVSLRETTYDEMVASGRIDQVDETCGVWTGDYDEVLGIAT